MQHPDNFARGQSALEPLKLFSAERQTDKEDCDIRVGDLICNLLHLCDTASINPVDVLRSGLGAYLQEAVDPDECATDVRVEFLINGQDEFMGLATLGDRPNSPSVCTAEATPIPSREGTPSPC